MVTHHNPRLVTTTGLYTAAARNDVAMVDLLFRNAADVDAWESANYYTPVAACAIHGSADALALLIAAGANLHLHGLGGYPPVEIAARMNRPQIVSMLARAGESTILGTASSNMGPFASSRFRNDWAAMLLLLRNADLENPEVRNFLMNYRYMNYSLSFCEEAIMTGNIEIATFFVWNDLVLEKFKRGVWLAALHYLEGHIPSYMGPQGMQYRLDPVHNSLEYLEKHFMDKHGGLASFETRQGLGESNPLLRAFA